MSIYSGPEIPTTGLVLALDAANAKSYSGSGNTTYNLTVSEGFTWQSLIGYVPALRYYKRVLSDSEVKQNFNATRGRYGV